MKYKKICLLRQSRTKLINKTGQNEKIVISSFASFLTTSTKVLFLEWKRDWVLGSAFTYFRNFFLKFSSTMIPLSDCSTAFCFRDVY